MASNAGEYTQEFRTVKTFGAVGDGVTDDSTAIQAAIDYAESLVTSTTAFASTGADVTFPPGKYLIGTTLTVEKSGVRLIGPGGNGAILTGNVLLVKVGDYTDTVNTTRLRDNAVQGLILKASATNNATAALELYRTIGARVECTFVDFNIGIDSYRSTGTDPSGSNFQNPNRTTNALAFIRMQGIDETARAIPNTYAPGGNWFMQNCDGEGDSAAAFTTYGLYILACDGFYSDNCHFNKVRYGISCEPDATPANHIITGLMFDNFYADQASSLATAPVQVRLHGTVKETITMASAATQRSVYEGIRFNGVYLRGGAVSRNGVSVSVTDGDTWVATGTRKLEDIAFVGGEIEGFTQNGVLIAGASSARVEPYGVRFTGITFDDNNADGTITDGTAISAECQNIAIYGNTFGADANAATTVIAINFTISGSEVPSLAIGPNDFTQSNFTGRSPVTYTALSGTQAQMSGNLYPGVGRDISETVKITTTNATATVIWSRTIPATTSGRISVVAAASDASVAEYGVYTITGRFIRTTAGAAAWLGADPVNDYTNDSGGMPATPIVASFVGNVLTLTVTGIAATPITWNAKIDFLTSK